MCQKLFAEPAEPRVQVVTAVTRAVRLKHHQRLSRRPSECGLKVSWPLKKCEQNHPHEVSEINLIMFMSLYLFTNDLFSFNTFICLIIIIDIKTPIIA